MAPGKQCRPKLFLSALLLKGVGLTCLLVGGIAVRADPQHLSLPSPERIRESLTEGSEKQRKGLVESLRLFLPPGARTGGQQLPCMEYKSTPGRGATVDLHQVVLKAPGPQTVIVARPQDCEYQFLVVMEQIAPGQWAHRGTVPIFAKHWEPEISFRQLVSAGESEIVVRNRPTDIGTGMLQRNMTIFKLLDGSLRVILDEVEKQTFAIPTTRNGQPANTAQTQESEFWLIDSEPGEQSIKDIVEKQVIRDHETQLVRWRLFLWRPELEVFQAVGTDGNPGEGKAGTIKLTRPDSNQ